jgi:hypothetical protein
LTKSEVDEAFEWMVLIIGIISAIMIQYPEYFYTLSPGVSEPSLKAAKSIVIPLVIVIFIWLVGKLAVSNSVQVLAKVVAWVFVTDVTVSNYYGYMQGLIWFSGFDYLRAGLNDVFVSFGMMLFFLVGPVLTHFVVVPKYRKVYADSMLLRNNVRLVITYAVIQVCVFGLAIVLAYSN